MDWSEIRTQAKQPEIVVRGESARPTEERRGWLSRLVTEAILKGPSSVTSA